MEKYYYSYREFLEDTKTLINRCKEYDCDVLLAISRGGLTLGHFMGEALDIRNVVTLNSIHYEGTKKLDTFNIFNIPDLSDASKVLILDDIVDSGETMREIFRILKEKFPHVEFKLATLFYKTTAVLQPDFSVKEAPAWIDFFWEVDLKE
ncbi:MAG: phosphoribosyltransferase [Candidatus Marinarcus sp.]|uniref:phosphoribosyltransferase n=1 Tax=Candidatus Marinarcus sp. TaxID=3100987 RepID=UPI003B0100C7